MDTTQTTKTYKFRVKDRHAKLLCAMAYEVNQVWNYCNALSCRSITERGRFMSNYDLDKHTAGASKEFNHIGSATIQTITSEYATRRKQSKSRKLNWRKSFGKQRSLGWVPFKTKCIRYQNGQFVYMKKHFKFWNSYGITKDTEIRTGCFAEDSRGRWYCCVTVKVDVKPTAGQDKIGIDLGLRTTATCSDGTKFDSHEFKEHEDQLAIAQRAKRKKRARAIHAKIKNKRMDAQHKFSTELVNRCGEIYIGDVSSSKLIKTKMAKSVQDASWYSFKTMLLYKSQQAGIVCKVVSEAYSTRQCSKCGSLSGPQGLTGLAVSSWKCVVCATNHDRDVNAALNILNGAGHCPP